ncbi:hypothetical protein ACFQ67_00215 [Streptomyces sp. NPDC056488]|uniref:hypothetical protein n=1 Tax=Streptomyces sp. NPDC056488 TaxID=3345836 RepID=UPI0036A30883
MPDRFRLDLLQLALADRIDHEFAEAPMTQRLAESQALRVTEAMYGPGTYSEQAEHALVTSLPPVLPGDTRADYATRLRLFAQGVAA